MKRKAVSLLAMALCASMAVPAMAEIKFSDANDVPWETAKVYISQAAELGLMVGQENSDGTYLFRAKDKVTFFETEQMAYNLLKSAKEAEPSDEVTEKWKKTMASYNVPQWAYEATAYCLENKIVLEDELSAFSGSSADVYATREDVAVVFGRVLEKVNGKKETTEVSFKDKDKIDDDAIEYVALLADNKILMGDDNSNFNPGNYINRAEMAVIVTKTYNVINGKTADDGMETVTGTVMGISENGGKKTITVKSDDSGATNVFSGDKDTPASSNGKDYSFTNIENGDKVTVVAKDEEVLLAVVTKGSGTKESEKTGEVSGSLVNMLSDKVIVELESGAINEYKLASQALITLNAKPVSYKDVSKVVENGVKCDVAVTLNSSGLAENIAVIGEENTVVGKITDIDDHDMTIKRDGGNEKVYNWDNECKFYFEGEKKNIAELSDLFDDYGSLNVTAELNDDGELLYVMATLNSEGGTVSGAIKNVTNEKVVFFNEDGSTESYTLAEGVYVLVDGEESTVSKVTRLLDDEDIGLTGKVVLNKQKQVTKLEVEVIDNLYGKISSLSEYYIEITTQAGVTKKYALAEDVDVKFGTGGVESLEDLESIYQKDVTEVKLSLNRDDEVSKITVYVDFDDYDVVTGTLKNVEKDQFDIKYDTIEYSDKSEITINGEKATAADIYKHIQNGEVLKADVVVVDGFANIITANVAEAEGKVVDIRNGIISVQGKTETKDYNILDEEDDIRIRIDGTSQEYTFREFYSLYYLYENDYNVIVEFNDEHVIDRIYAETI